YQYKDHLGNIRLSYNKGGNKTFLNDTFDSSTDGWGGGGVSAVNGRLGVKVRYMYSGTNKKITHSFSAGETVKIRLKLDANGKGYKMRVLVNEIDAANASTGWYSAGDAPEGNFEATYQIKQDASKLNIKLGLTSSIAAEEEIYLDDISVVQETEEGIIVQQEKNYYPFGLQHRGYNFAINGSKHDYGFGGKEEQDELGLGWIDVTARNYDPALGRWMNLDPLAEKMRRHSPYNYAFDNPIYFIDYDGMAPNDFYRHKKTGKVVWIDGSSRVKGFQHLGYHVGSTDVDGNRTHMNGDTRQISVNGKVVNSFGFNGSRNSRGKGTGIDSWGREKRGDFLRPTSNGKAIGQLNISDLPISGVRNFKNKALAFIKDIIGILNKENKIGDNVSENSSSNSNSSTTESDSSSSTMSAENTAGEEEAQENEQDTTNTTVTSYKDKPVTSTKFFPSRKEAEKDSVKKANDPNTKSVIINDF
ncbi:RHS repeat domain-containing protein, partial [Aquimarina sp. Aq78]